jgi:hypothetical protein
MSFDIKTLNSSEIHLTDLSTGTHSHQGVFLKNLLINRSENIKSPNRLILEGLHINIWTSENGVVIPGVELMRSSDPGSTESEKKAGFIPTLLRIPAVLEPYMKPGFTLQFKNSFCTISSMKDHKIKKITVPLEALFSIKPDGKYEMHISAELNKIHKIPFLPDEIEVGSAFFKLHSTGYLYAAKMCENFKADMTVKLKDVVYLGKNMKVILPEFAIAGNAEQDSSAINGSVLVSAADCSVTSSFFKIPSAGLSVPVTFRYTDKMNFADPGKEVEGKISIEDICLKNINTGPVSFIIRQKNNTFTVKSSIAPDFLIFQNSDEKIDIKSELKVDNDFKFIENHLTLKSEHFSPAGIIFGGGGSAPDIEVGSFMLSSYIKADRKKITTSADVKIEKTDIRDEKNNITVKGLNAECFFPNLPEVKSAPDQKILCSSVQIGNIKFSDFSVNYQIESPGKIFLEKTGMKWCGGNIDIGALRIDVKKPENIAMTLFCDRVNVAELMSQLKIAEAEGDGTVAGRIPLSYNSGQLRINNAFLYSIPGYGGVIKIKDFADSYLDTSASAPLDIAKEALADYKYKWVKLLMNSQGENLFIKLELDGKPNKKLPFTYNAERGGFVRSKDKSKTAHFQGISFEFNFNNIPLDSIINIGRNSSEFMNLKK